MPTDERVLCIPADRLRAAGYFHGFRRADDCYRAALLDPTNYTFKPRREVESDPSFKQIIPYVVLTCGGRAFHYRRGKAGTETRLTALRSIGIGGHVSDVDAVGGDDPYRTALFREVAEEVLIRCGYDDRFLGFINDDTTPVGAVHLGVVHVFVLDEEAAEPREDALAGAGWAPLAELREARQQFETWSQFVLEELAQ